MTDRTKKCKDLVSGQFRSTMKDLCKRLTPSKDDEHADPILSYGYGFDYVPRGTFERQRQGYFRWTLSGGGPSSEIRFFAEPGTRGWNLVRAEYWYMDWFDGAKRNIKAGPDFKVLEEIWSIFDDLGSPQSEFERAEE